MKTIEINGITRRLGWVPDTPDKKAVKFAEKRMLRVRQPCPPLVDLEPKCSPIKDQKNLGCCSGFAINGIAEFLMLKDGLPLTLLSELFTYFGERLIEDTVDSDSGARIQDGIDVSMITGLCADKLWPYDISRFAETPPPEAYADAGERVVSAQARLESLDDVRQCLADGYPIAFGFSVYSNIKNLSAENDWTLDPPGPDDELLGGHAVGIVGYDDVKRRLKIRNSWAKEFALGGYFYLSYDFVPDRDLSDDYHTIRAGTEL